MDGCGSCPRGLALGPSILCFVEWPWNTCILSKGKFLFLLFKKLDLVKTMLNKYLASERLLFSIVPERVCLL